MMETSSEIDREISHLDEIEIPCDTCQTWISDGIPAGWEQLLPARWSGRIAEHPDCSASGLSLLVCDYHARYRGYRCGFCDRSYVDIVGLQRL